jgi:protoporphyrinogen oxidase
VRTATANLPKAGSEYRFVIIGAGLTGLAAAARLDELGHHDYLLIEAGRRPGGWATTDRTDAYAADRATHVLYFRDEHVRRRVERLLEGRWIRHTKNCVIDSMGIRTPFPFHANLYGRPAAVVAECLDGILQAAAADERAARSPATFLDWIMRSFGPGVARHFMIPYNTKLWTVGPESMTADWMGAFVPPVDVRRVLEGATLRLDSSIGLNAEFFYPEDGISMLADRLATGLQGTVRFATRATALSPAGRQIQLSDGSTCSFESVISTIPLPRIVAITRDIPPPVKRSVGSLRAMDLVVVDVGTKQTGDEGEHWAYLPDPDVLGFRLGFVHNLTDRLMPKGHGLLSMEIAHAPHRPLPPGSTTTRTVADLVRLGWVGSESDVTFVRERRFACAYAIPLIGSAEASDGALRALRDLGIHSVGRFGSWKYSNMEDALVDGARAADRVVMEPAV